MQYSLLSEIKFQLHLLLDKLEWYNASHYIKYNNDIEKQYIDTNYESACSDLIQKFRLKCNTYFMEYPTEFKSVCLDDHTFRIKVYNTLQHETIDYIVFNKYGDQKIIDIKDNDSELEWKGYFTCSL